MATATAQSNVVGHPNPGAAVNLANADPSSSGSGSSSTSAPLSWEGDKMFNIYIYDYCSKRGFRKTAKELLVEAEIPPDSTPPINARQGLLFEWWSVFWVLFSAKSGNGQPSEDALVYTAHQSIQQAQHRQTSLQLAAQHGGLVIGGNAPLQPPPPGGGGAPNGGPQQVGQQPQQPQGPGGVPGRPGQPMQRPNGGSMVNGYNGPMVNGIGGLGARMGQRPNGTPGGQPGQGQFQSPNMDQHMNPNVPGGSNMAPQNGAGAPNTPGARPQTPSQHHPNQSPHMSNMAPPGARPGPGGPHPGMQGHGPQGSMGPPGSGNAYPPHMQSQTGRPPSRSATPGQGGMIGSSPSMAHRQIQGQPGGPGGPQAPGQQPQVQMMQLMSEPAMIAELQKIPPQMMPQLKAEVGLEAGKDISLMNSEDKGRIIQAYKNKMGVLNGQRRPQPNATAGPSMQPPVRGAPPRPNVKRQSISPGDEPEQPPNGSSPPDRKRLRRSPMDPNSAAQGGPQQGPQGAMMQGLGGPGGAPPGQFPQGQPPHGMNPQHPMGGPGPGMMQGGNMGNMAVNGMQMGRGPGQGGPGGPGFQGPPGMGGMGPGGPPGPPMNPMGAGMPLGGSGPMAMMGGQLPMRGPMPPHDSQYRAHLHALNNRQGLNMMGGPQAAASPSADPASFNPAGPAGPSTGGPPFPNHAGGAPGNRMSVPGQKMMPPPPSPGMPKDPASASTPKDSMKAENSPAIAAASTPGTQGGNPPTPSQQPAQPVQQVPTMGGPAGVSAAQLLGNNGMAPTATNLMNAELFSAELFGSLTDLGVDPTFDLPGMGPGMGGGGPGGDLNFERDFAQWFSAEPGMGPLDIK